MSAPRTIHVAHSPDSDDAFMFYALAVEHLGVLVHRRPCRHPFDVRERIQDRLRRCLEDHFSGCPYGHAANAS